MGLNLIVLVKQVPDTQNITGEAMKEDGTVNRAALPAVFNPEDLFALEAALQLKDEFPGTKVNVISMGPPAAIEVLKECLYRGADFAALVSDRGFAGADTLATSYALKCAIEKIGSYDIIFAGRQAIDGDTAQVGPQTAEKLDMNQITCVSELKEIDIENKNMIARRSIEGGFEVVKTPFPVLITFTDEGYVPRPPSAMKIMAYKKVSMETPSDVVHVWNIQDIKADPEQCGLSGSPTKVKAIQSVVLTGGDIKMIENTEDGIAGLVHELIADHTLG